MAKPIRDIAPKSRPAKEFGTSKTEPLKIDLSSYNNQDDGGVRVKTSGVVDLHKIVRKDYPLETAAFTASTKHEPNAKDHGHIPAPKDVKVNDDHNQRETARKKNISKTDVANIRNRAYAGAYSMQTSESVMKCESCGKPEGKMKGESGGCNCKQPEQPRFKGKTIVEKHLTSAELSKREEIATAIERDRPGMPMGKKMAIATSTAKKVAEESEHIVERVRKIVNKKKGETYPSSNVGDKI
jgi:hypothetical protein